MMLTISFRQPDEEKEITVMVDSGQKIAGTIRVMKEAGIINTKDCHIVRSTRTKERIETEKSYSEGHIYNGDILIFD